MRMTLFNPLPLFTAAMTLAAAAGLPTESHAQLRVSRVFADGMVMQRAADVPVWGRAPAGAAVAVEFRNETYDARADDDGAWSVRLPQMAAGGPHTMRITSGDERIVVADILIGDVWVASGQSNMEWQVAEALNAEAEIAAADDAAIRQFYVPHSWAETPVDTLAGGWWSPATPEHVGAFTAVGYFFARALRKHVDVPIGLVHTSWGGSRIEPWMSAEALDLDAEAFEQTIAEERARVERLREELRQKLGRELPMEDAGMDGGRAAWANPSLDDAGWATIGVPRLWEEVGYEGLDGVAWYRTTFDLTEEEAARGVTLGLGMIDDTDVTWVNGHEVGGMESAWNTPRVYEIPASGLTAGTNTVVVRVTDTGGGGGIAGGVDLLYLDAGGERRALPDEWKFRVGRVNVDVDSRMNQVPTVLYNQMIHPLLRFPIKGVLWYQGESNAYPGAAYEYRDLFQAMIRDWRARWNSVAGAATVSGADAGAADGEDAAVAGNGAADDDAAGDGAIAEGDDAAAAANGSGSDFPFLFVQLAGYMEPDDQPSESAWAMLRESQSAALALPNTAQAVAIDIGEADDIHPRNKQVVGRRLALAARKVAYDQRVVHSGPSYTGHALRDGRVVIAFDHVGGGLRARGGTLGGFAVAGEDGEFVWANAEIDGDNVVVWSDAVPQPVAVRYAWGNNPTAANLYNREGLPASPFRTDSW